MGRLAHVALVAVFALAGCTRRDVVTRDEIGAFRPDTDPKRVVVRTGASPLESRWLVDGNIVTGTLAWARACRAGLVRERVHHVRTSDVADVPANLAWIAASAGMLAGSGALFASSWDGSVTARASTVPPAIVLGVGGGFAGVTALAALFAQREEQPYGAIADRKDEVSVAPAPIACGGADDLARSMFALALAGGARVRGAFHGASVGFVLPARADARRASLVVDAAEGARLESGERVAEIDLAAYAAFVESPPVPPAFSGSFFAESIAFARTCRPHRTTETCNGVDHDCDGFYDIGCGYRAGSLQWTLAWAASATAALELVVTGPDDVAVSSAARVGGASGLAMDVACGESCERHVENVFLPIAVAPSEGTYRAEVRVLHPPPDVAAPAVRATLAWRVAGRAFRGDVLLHARRSWRATLLFALGPDRDKDGVIDREDACPDERGSFFTPPPRRGCPRATE